MDTNGACTWAPANESASAQSQAYQEFITGVPFGWNCVANGVRFDGFDAATGSFIEAKGLGYAKDAFYNENGTPKAWYEESGHAAMINQLGNQAQAANGRPVVWYVADELAAARIAQIILNNRLLDGKITVIFRAPQ